VLAGATVVTADRPDQWTDRIYRERVGREVWRFLVLLAVLILAVEALVAATGTTTRATSPGNANARGGG
jgi:hypothetical protein